MPERARSSRDYRSLNEMEEKRGSWRREEKEGEKSNEMERGCV
jgi:hypothetical protein